MWERDYILRMVHQATLVLTRVFGLRRQGDDEGALDVIEEAYGTLAGLSPSLVHGLSDDDLLGLLRTRGSLDADRCLALVELLREEADIYEDDDQPEESFPRYLKAVRLTLEVTPALDGMTTWPAAAKLDELLQRLDSFELPTAMLIRLVEHFEKSGRFDRAEDSCWELIDVAPEPEAFAIARQFYERLLEFPDDALVTGGLPRDEVSEGLHKLDEMSG